MSSTFENDGDIQQEQTSIFLPTNAGVSQPPGADVESEHVYPSQKTTPALHSNRLSQKTILGSKRPQNTLGQNHLFRKISTFRMVLANQKELSRVLWLVRTTRMCSPWKTSM